MFSFSKHVWYIAVCQTPIPLIAWQLIPLTGRLRRMDNWPALQSDTKDKSRESHHHSKKYATTPSVREDFQGKCDAFQQVQGTGRRPLGEAEQDGAIEMESGMYSQQKALPTARSLSGSQSLACDRIICHWLPCAKTHKNNINKHPKKTVSGP